jgi:hypothetical protein
VGDSRLRLRTTLQAVADGQQVTHRDGGEREPGELDKVPNDDQTVITSFIFGWEDGWRYVGPSPLKKLLGPGAIGGRATVSKAHEGALPPVRTTAGGDGSLRLLPVGHRLLQLCVTASSRSHHHREEV